MTLVVAIALGYAALAYGAIRASTRVCRDIESFADGPRPGNPPIVTLIVSAACIGAILAARQTSAQGIAVAALLTASLVACCYSDIVCGIVPDAFTVAPLAVVLVESAVVRDGRPALSALILVVPFGLAAFFSGGLGMGWGDVKLVSFAAAVIGFEVSIVAFSAACFLAAVTALIRRRQSEPIALVPYLSAAAAVALALPSSQTLSHVLSR